MRRRSFAAGMLALGLAAAASACTRPESEEPSVAPTTAEAIPGSALPDVLTSEVDTAALPAHTEVLGASSTHLAALEARTRAGLTILDLESGTPSAELDSTASAAGFEVEDNIAASSLDLGEARLTSGGVLLVPYLAPECSEEDQLCLDEATAQRQQPGLLALDPADGTLAWAAPFRPEIDEQLVGSAVTRIVTATEEIAVVHLWLLDRDDAAANWTLVVDLAEGELLWSLQGTTPAYASAGVVAAVRMPGPDDRDVLLGLDLSSGDVVWEGEDASTHRWMPAAPAGALAGIWEESSSEGSVIDLASGKAVAPATPWAVFVEAPTGPYAAWLDSASGTNALLSIGEGESQPSTVPLPVEAASIELPDDQGYLWCRGSEGVVAVNRTGSVRSSPIGGTALFAGQGTLVTGEGDGSSARVWEYSA